MFLFPKSTKRAVKQFTKARAELLAVVTINQDKITESHSKDQSYANYIEALIKGIKEWESARRSKRIVKRMSNRADIDEANAWLNALPEIKK